MDSNLVVETELNSVSQVADETLAVEGQSKAITDPENTSAEQPRRGDIDAKQGGTPERRRLLSWVHRVEVAVLSAVIVLVWGLLTLPIVFYYLPDATVIGRSTCEQTDSTRYTGTVCREHLQSCLNTPGAGDIYVSLTVNEQVEAERTAMLLEFGLDQLQASDECRQAALPFVCLYLFGLCDGNGTLHSPSAMDCLLISTELCVAEWAAGQSQLDLPECSTLPKQSSVTCKANTTTSPPISPPVSTTHIAPVPSGTSASTSVVVATNCTVQCRDSFYCTINNTCRPRCGSWEQNSHTVIVATDVVVIISASVGVIAGAVVFIITCIRRKQLLVFPTIIVQYITAILVIFASVVLISYFDRTGLFCSSIDLQTSIENTMPFCTFAGVMFYYTLLQLAIWWFFHVATLFWKIQFPFHSRRFERAHRMKYLHIAMVITALLIPVIPVVAETVAGGFAITRFPPILCTGTSSKATFYALVLPIIVLLQIGITLLIVIFWIIHKHHGLFREKMSKQPIKIGTAERKILVVFCYYVLLGVIALTSFTLTTRNLRDFIRNTLFYFACEMNGIDPSCDRSTFEDLSYPELAALSYILLGLFSAVNLIYVINVKEISQFCHRKYYRPEVLSSTEKPSTTSTSTTGVTTAPPAETSVPP